MSLTSYRAAPPRVNRAARASWARVRVGFVNGFFDLVRMFHGLQCLATTYSSIA